MKPVVSRTVAIESLDEAQIVRMFELFEQYYIDVDFDRFRSDLRDKTHCMLFSQAATSDPNPIGFSTFSLRRLPHLAPGRFLFSGDTVVHQGHWGRQLLQRQFLEVLVKCKLASPFEPLYWMLISKGYITYLMMVDNFPHSFPRYDRATPESLDRVLRAFYQDRYGDDFDASRGVIEFEESHGAVDTRIVAPKQAIAKNPHVEFFLTQNPGHSRGVELASLALIRTRDLLRHALQFRTGRKTGTDRKRRMVAERVGTTRESRAKEVM